MHASQAWKDAEAKNGWTDAYLSGERVRLLPHRAGQARRRHPDHPGPGPVVTFLTGPRRARRGAVPRAGRRRRPGRRRSACPPVSAAADPVGTPADAARGRRLLVVVPAFLAVDVLRGGRGEAGGRRGRRPGPPQRLAHRRPAAGGVRRQHRPDRPARLGRSPARSCSGAAVSPSAAGTCVRDPLISRRALPRHVLRLLQRARHPPARRASCRGCSDGPRPPDRRVRHRR